MRHSAIAALALLAIVLAGGEADAQPAGSGPRAVTVARTTEMIACSSFVDAGAGSGGDGTAQRPHRTIAAAVAAAGNTGAAICVAEGSYAEQLKPGEKSFTLAGGFQRGQGFKVRDSAAYVTKATGRGGSFIRIEDPGPKGDQRTVVDGFDISGYSQAIVREYYESQRFDLTNNHIHDNKCASDQLAGAGFALNNVSGRIEGNVFRNNSCGRGGAGFLNDSDQGEYGHDRAQPHRPQCRHRARHRARRGALPLWQDAADHRQPVHRQQSDPMGRRPLRRRRHVQRPVDDG